MEIRNQAIEAIVIGASAGGVQALLQLLRGLPAGYRLPIIAVLHLPKGQESHLAEVFRPQLKLPVCQVQDKQPVEPGQVYFAPPDYHLSIEREHLSIMRDRLSIELSQGSIKRRCSFSLSCEEPVLYSRPAIDMLFSSAADAYGPALAAIVLTGASHDGAQGLANVKAAGGLTLVQDPAEAESATMPQAAIESCQPNHILNLQGLHAALLAMENH